MGLITVKPIQGEKTGVTQAFEQFIKETNLKFVKIK